MEKLKFYSGVKELHYIFNTVTSFWSFDFPSHGWQISNAVEIDTIQTVEIAYTRDVLCSVKYIIKVYVSTFYTNMPVNQIESLKIK